MKHLMLYLICGLVFLSVTEISAQSEFSKYFREGTLRIDYFHSGNDTMEIYSLDELRAEPYYGGSEVNLVDTFGYGKFKIEISDSASGRVIYSKGYSSLFGEWQTTPEAKKVIRSFSETFTLPFPKRTVMAEFFSRNRQNRFVSKFRFYIDPSSPYISPERHNRYNTFNVVQSGLPSVKVDLIIIPDGYKASEMEKFRKDCSRFAEYLFKCSPFKENRDKFNIRGVEAISEDSGPDIPAQNVWKKTVVGTSFYTFGEDRYLMTTENKAVRDVAANAPYDQIYILVNSTKYGAGSIYNYYSTCVSNNMFEEYIFTHEFGHGFAGLGDEYYTSSVAYENFYPAGVEPWEPNITTLVDFGRKWENMLSKNTPVPTPDTDKYKSVPGVFEGAGYSAKGVYRPAHDCTMKSISVDNFCPVCRRAIQKMIDFYSH